VDLADHSGAFQVVCRRGGSARTIGRGWKRSSSKTRSKRRRDGPERGPAGKGFRRREPAVLPGRAPARPSSAAAARDPACIAQSMNGCVT
jgi:hypothetical protein